MSKRQLGLLFIGLGVAAILGLFLLDLVRDGHQGIGPAQQQAMIVAGIGIVAGLTLVPLGDRPA